MRSAFKTVRRPRSTPPCWMKASTAARSAPCTASWSRKAKFTNVATSSPIRLTRSRSCWPPRPNQLWSWDITKLLGPAKWTYFYLYVILDVFSRYVVGWMIADREGKELAKQFIAETCDKQDIRSGQLKIHADRGSSMTSKPVAFMLADLGVTKTHSRPHVSDDNPFSESQFKTLKYRPEFPDRFGSIQHARSFCREFFPWYNTEHHHSGLGLLTPEVVHRQCAEQVRGRRQLTLDGAYAAHPERFVRKPPQPPALPTEVWINPPPKSESALADSEKKTQ